MKLIPVLRAIAENEERDVRKVIKHYRRDLAQYAIDFRGISAECQHLLQEAGPDALDASKEEEDFAVTTSQKPK